MATDPNQVALAMRRFADATSAYMLAAQAQKEAAAEVIAAHAELRALGVNVTMPGAAPPTPPPNGNAATSTTPTPPGPVDEDAELRAAIAGDAYTPKPPKTDAT